MRKKYLWRDVEWMYQKWDVEKLTTKEMAELAGCEISVLCAWLNRLGVRSSTDGSPRMSRREIYKQKDWLIQKYLIDGLNTIEMGDLVERTSECIRYWLNKYGISRVRYSTEEAYNKQKCEMYEEFKEEERVKNAVVSASMEGGKEEARCLPKLKPTKSGRPDSWRRAISVAVKRSWKSKERRKKQADWAKGFWTGERRKCHSDLMKKRWAEGVYEGVYFGTPYRTTLEAEVADILDDLELEYCEQFVLSGDAYNRRFDFYIPKYRITIECQGSYWHTEETNPDVTEKDRAKHQLAKDNGVFPIEIWDYELRSEDGRALLARKMQGAIEDQDSECFLVEELVREGIL